MTDKGREMKIKQRTGNPAEVCRLLFYLPKVKKSLKSKYGGNKAVKLEKNVKIVRNKEGGPIGVIIAVMLLLEKCYDKK